MTADKKGYFLLDAVLAILVLSILISAILLSLETSLRALKKVNSDLVSLYRVENILIKKMILRDNFENSGYIDKDSELSYLLELEEIEHDISRVAATISKDNNIKAQLSTLILN